MKLETLRDLYVEQLKDLYDAESQLVKALPQMAKAASSKILQDAFRSHLEETKEHVKRIEQIADKLGVSTGGKKCKAMQGLIAEGSEAINEDSTSEVRDAALIAAAQRVEHYEIAGYGTIRTYASTLGETKAVEIIQQTLTEESETDKKLTQLAEHSINLKAQEGNASH